MIKDNKFLTTDWDVLYTKFDEEFNVDVFDNDCTEEWPLFYLLDEMKDDENTFRNIIEFFLTHYACILYNNVTGVTEKVTPGSPEWYEGYEDYKKLILSLATYYQNEYIKSILNKAFLKKSKKES